MLWRHFFLAGLLLSSVTACYTPQRFLAPATYRDSNALLHEAKHLSKSDLLARMQHLGALIHYTPQKNHILYPRECHFKENSSTLNARLQQQLDLLAGLLHRYPRHYVIIYGHTDNAGGTQANQALAERRAHAVRAYLVYQGIPQTQLLVKGLGESQPLASNQTAGGKRQNRRVEISLLEHDPHRVLS